MNPRWRLQDQRRGRDGGRGDLRRLQPGRVGWHRAYRVGRVDDSVEEVRGLAQLAAGVSADPLVLLRVPPRVDHQVVAVPIWEDQQEVRALFLDQRLGLAP